jgi:hypothetical protein
MKPPKWTLVFGLALICAPSEVASSRDDSHGRNEGGRDASSLRSSALPGNRTYSATPVSFEHLPLGLAEESELPPGLRKESSQGGRPAVPAIPSGHGA